jgi:DNA polymerase-1
MKKLLLIDANSLLYRCFFALPPLTAPDGTPSGGLYGLASILLKIFRECRPDYCAAAFDRPEPTFRRQAFAAYKITRPPAPDPLVSQVKEAPDLFASFGIKSFSLAGFEADDIIATFSRRFSAETQVIILSGDHDTLQAVEDNRIIVWLPKRGISDLEVYNEEKVVEKYGLKPERLNDYKGLVGDKSDNIPGVRGVGPKTATNLIQQFGRLEDFFELAAGSTEPKYRKILEQKEIALLSKELATLNFEVSLKIPLEELSLAGFDRKETADFFRAKGFHSLINRLEK